MQRNATSHASCAERSVVHSHDTCHAPALQGSNPHLGKATTHDGNAVSIDLACDPAQALDQGRGSLDTLSASITSLVAVSRQPTLQSR